MRLGEDGQIPIVSDYNTRGVPRGLFIDSSGGHSRGNKLESKPGLYRFKQEYVSKLHGDNYPDEGCMDIKGSFQQEQARIFTQDAMTAEHAQYEVPNSDLLRVCLAEGAPEEAALDFYVWRK